MNLIFNNSKKEVVRNGVVCPICGQTGDIERDDDEPYYVWCTCSGCEYGSEEAPQGFIQGVCERIAKEVA